MNSFDPQKHILQIQFKTVSIPFSGRDLKTITIDFRRQILIIGETDPINKKTHEKNIKIDQKNFLKLLPYAELKIIRDFEAIERDMTTETFVGYRDLYWVEYTYYSMSQPTIIHGTLSWIYEDNPIEKISEWIQEFIPEEDIRL